MGILQLLRRAEGKIITAALVILAAALALGAAKATEQPVRTAKQNALHEAAEMLRAAGYTDEDAPVRALSEAWWEEQHKLDVLARVIDGEARDCPWDHRVAVGVAVLNRVADERFPDTIDAVVAQPYQYSIAYLSGFSRTARGSYEAAAAALDGRHNVPPDVVWQAQFPQGNSIWWISEVDTGWYASTTYFCR